MSWFAFPEGVPLLNVLLILSGIQPVFDRLQNGSKYSWLGITFVIVHIGMCVYSDRKLQDEQNIEQHTLKGIMFAMTYLQRYANLALPIFNVIGAFAQFSSMAQYRILEDEMDYYLRCLAPTKVLTMHRNIKRSQWISCVVALVVSSISCASCVLTFCKTFKKDWAEAEFYTYYTGIFFTLNFIAINFKMSLYYYGLSLRMDLFNGEVEKILNLDRKLNLTLMRS